MILFLEYFHYPNKSLIPICSHSPFLHPGPGKHQSSLYLQSFHLWILHINGIKQYVVICIWLLSFHIRIFRFTLVVACVGSFFLCIVKQYSMVWIYHNLFIYSPLMNIWIVTLSLFIMNNVTINIHIQVFDQTCVFISLGQILEGRIPVSYGRFIFSFLRSCQAIFQNIYSILNSHQCMMVQTLPGEFKLWGCWGWVSALNI